MKQKIFFFVYIIRLKKKNSVGSLDLDTIDQTKKSAAVNLKIFLNYAQMIAIISLFDLNWPYRVKDLIEKQAALSSISNQILSVDCLLRGIFYIYFSL